MRSFEHQHRKWLGWLWLKNSVDQPHTVTFFAGCDAEFVQAVVALNLNMNFLIAILVCLAVILIAVIVLAVYRKKRHVFA